MVFDAPPVDSRMTCQEFDQVLYPYLDGEFAPEDAVAIEGHLAGCSGCSGKVHSEQQLLAVLRSVGAGPGRQVAPAQLRERVQRSLRLEHRRANAKQWMRLSAAAAALVVIGAGAYFNYRPYARKRFVDDAALRHAKRFPPELEQVSPQQIEAWFGGKLDHRVALPRFPNAVPSGARLLNVQEKQAAYISYDATAAAGAPRRMGLFVYDDKQRDADFDALDHADLGTSHGYNVVSWREGDVVYQLVSDLDEADIRKMLTFDEPHVGDRRPTVPVRPASLRQ